MLSRVVLPEPGGAGDRHPLPLVDRERQLVEGAQRAETAAQGLGFDQGGA